MSLGTAGLVIGGQTTVPVTPEEASADAAALGGLVGGRGASGTGGGSAGPVVFTGGGGRGRGCGVWGMGGVVIVAVLNVLLMGFGF